MITEGQSPCDEGVMQSGAWAAECAEASKVWVLAAAVLGSSLAFILGSVVNVALPAMQRGLGASVAEMQWVVNAYALFLGALILIGGSAGDRFGRRRIFVIGTVIFAVASVACGWAPDATTLILARAVQGIGGALLVPSSLALISATFSEDERGQAIGTWAGFSALTTAFGPLLGGWLVDAFSWRWVFFVVLPLAALTLLITARYVPESKGGVHNDPIDGWGALLTAASLGFLTYGFIAAPERGFADPAVWGTLALGIGLGAACLRVEARHPDPMLPLYLFRSTTFSGANALTLLLYFALGGVFFFLPFNLIQVQGYSATEAGAAFLPFTLIVGSLSRWSGGLVERYGARRPLIIGPLISAVGMALFIVPGVGGSFWATFFPAMLVLGLGMAISIAPLTTVVMNAVDQEHAGAASGVNNAASRVASLLAVAILGIVMLGVFRSTLDARTADLEMTAETRAVLAEVRRDLTGADLQAMLGDKQQTVERAVKTSFVRGFRVTMGIGAVLALLSAGCALFTIAPLARGGDDEEQPDAKQPITGASAGDAARESAKPA